MKSLLINLIIAIFLISCASIGPGPNGYDYLSCDELKREQIKNEKEIKAIKESDEYKKETANEIKATALMIPLCILFYNICISKADEVHPSAAFPQHASIDGLKKDTKLLKEAAERKHCPKEIDYEVITDKSHTMHFPH